MNGAGIMDFIVGGVLLAFVVFGVRRGLVCSVAGLASVVLALVGAGLIANALTPHAVGLVRPLIEKRVEARIDAALNGETGGDSSAGSPPVAGNSSAVTGGNQALPDGAEDEDEESAADRILAYLKLDGDAASAVAKAAKEKVRSAGVSALTAVEESLAETVIHALLFAVSFLILLLLLRLLTGVLNLAAKLPGLSLLNGLGGAVIGAAEGALALFLGVWVLRRLGVSFDTLGGPLFGFFTTHTPLDVLSFL